MVNALLSTPFPCVPIEIWAIAWPRPPYLNTPVVVVITALGARGARLSPNDSLPGGTTVELCFVLPDAGVEIVCGAVVSETTSPDGTSVDFTLLSCYDRERLNTWVTDSHRQHTSWVRTRPDGRYLVSG